MALKHELIYHLTAFKKPLSLIFVALFLCILYQFSPALYLPLQWVLLISGFLWVGLPHGALDHLLESRNISGKITSRFVAKYVGIMALYFVLWWILPVFSFIIFILYSAFHFGQSDMEEWNVSRQKNIKALVWGVLLLGMLLFPHMNEVADIAGGMGVKLNAGIDWDLVGLFFAISAFGWGVVGKNKFMVLSTCMLILTAALPVLSAFGLYFIGQHSLNGWSHLKKGMQVSGKILFFKAFPFTAGALLLMAAALSLPLFGILPGSDESWISLFFVFLACISMPHVWAMHRFYAGNQQ
jgi:Brp/Blh family beta-carotene 15,15'-monooxygenase